MTRGERIEGFTETIWQWFERNKRVLPWRDCAIDDATQRAYMVLVSEVMLQQTQVHRVKIVFRDFLERFPSIHDLARATNRDVLLAWRGMGYNSRALRLRDAARSIVGKFPDFPIGMEELVAIPGIGHYTAAAIRNFAFNIPTPCIDTNIRRILHRTFFGPENPDGTWRVADRVLLKLAGEVLNEAVGRPCRSFDELRMTRRVMVSPSNHDTPIPRDPANWHAALMDFGSLVQTKNSPCWDICPLTAKGLMKTTKKSFESRVMSDEKRDSHLMSHDSRLREPGRIIAGRFTPNRIIRGRIVEFLRDEPEGAAFHDIGARVCIDWDANEHREWLRMILEKLKRDALIGNRGKKYVLAD